jgi:hypothetical protein
MPRRTVIRGWRTKLFRTLAKVQQLRVIHCQSFPQLFEIDTVPDGDGLSGPQFPPRRLARVPGLQQ